MTARHPTRRTPSAALAAVEATTSPLPASTLRPPSSRDPTTAWSQFVAAYDRLTARASGRQGPAFAAVTAMSAAQQNCHTVGRDTQLDAAGALLCGSPPAVLP